MFTLFISLGKSLIKLFFNFSARRKCSSEYLQDVFDLFFLSLSISISLSISLSVPLQSVTVTLHVTLPLFLSSKACCFLRSRCFLTRSAFFKRTFSMPSMFWCLSQFSIAINPSSFKSIILNCCKVIKAKRTTLTGLENNVANISSV